MALMFLAASETLSASSWQQVLMSQLAHTTYTGSGVQLSVQKTQAVTFLANDNQKYVGLHLNSYSATYPITITILLQEYSGGSWVTRTTDNFVIPAWDGMPTSLYNAGYIWYQSFPVTSYAVTTATNTWRYAVTASTSGCYWVSSTTYGFSMFVIGEGAASKPSATDTAIIGSNATLTIDESWEIGSGMTYAMLQCSPSTVQWENPPAASYTLTLQKPIWQGRVGCSFLVGSETDPIPANKQAIISFVGGFESSNMYSNWAACSSVVEFWGEKRSEIFSHIGIANASQPVVTTDTDMSATWQIGDEVYVHGFNHSSAGAGLVTTIANISGKTVTLANNLPYKTYSFSGITNTTIGQLSGIKLQSASTSLVTPFTAVNLHRIVISGVVAYLVRLTISYTSNQTFSNLIDSVLVYGTTAARPSFSLTPETRSHPKSNYGTVISNLRLALTGSDNLSGYGIRVTANNCTLSGMSVNMHGGTGGIVVSGVNCSVSDCWSYEAYSGGYGYPLDVSGARHTWSNCGGNGGSHFMNISGLFSSTLTGLKSGSNKGRAMINNIGGILIWSTNTIGTKFVDCDFSSTAIVPYNTNISSRASNTYFDSIFENCLWPTSTFLLSTAAGDCTYPSAAKHITRCGVVDQHGVNDVYGEILSCGDGLTDTTVHTAGTGKFAIRFESSSSTSRLEWSFKTPTGNIATKTMTVAVWCKINAAAYYSGTHQKPRLTIDYDNGTETYAEATESTDWQLLSVTFSPTTTFGQITVTLSTMTDATGSDAYVYFDDMSVLYPAGYKLDLGGMDLWADALPITPPIATVLSAGDVWNLPASGLTGTGTIGQILNALVTGQYHFDKTGGIETIKDSDGNTVATFTVTDTATEVTKT